jgi:hypothetical protein
VPCSVCSPALRQPPVPGLVLKHIGICPPSINRRGHRLALFMIAGRVVYSPCTALPASPADSNYIRPPAP